MFEKIETKNVMLIYSVIGFGSIALVALGELSGVEAGSFLYDFYLKLVFGGFLVFYTVLLHFTMLAFAKKMDDRGPKILKAIFGEHTSRIGIVTIVICVLLYWVLAFAELMRSSDFRFF